MILNHRRCLVPAMQVTQYSIFLTQLFKALYIVVCKKQRKILMFFCKLSLYIVLYTVEFQKHGLPHGHIIFWCQLTLQNQHQS
jgi:hypothetical protein